MDPIVGHESLSEKVGGVDLNFQTLKGTITGGIWITCPFPGLWFQDSDLASRR